jgi:uncharacterized protein (DUF1501 family)
MTTGLRTRREFLRGTALGGALASTVPAFLAQTWRALGAEALEGATAPVTGKDGRILVVLQLAGGNDGLNTVVPFADDHYRKARPRLAIPAGEVLRIDDHLGFHPALKALQALRQEGRMSLIQGVGYPNPNRSHFRSMEIWQTGSDSDRFEREGWIGRYFDHACAGADPTVGVSLGNQMPQAFNARTPKGISVGIPGRGGGARRGGGSSEEGHGGAGKDAGGDMMPGGSGDSVDALSGPSVARGAVLDFLDRTALDAEVSSAKVREITTRVRNQAEYPAHRLAQSLKRVAQLIAGGLSTRVYYVSQGGFDTHTNQAANHARLLGEFGDSMKAFVEDLRAQGNLSRVLVMTFSEFGRRVAENASGGTDHGAAGPMFLFGSGFRAPVVGESPDLAPGSLVQGDPRFSLDFRRVYATVLDQWLETSSGKVLGRKFEPVAIL